MRYQCVVGNPPYANDFGGGNATFRAQTYTKHYISAMAFSDRFISMIMPARWLQNQGSGIKSLHDTMMASKHVAKLDVYVDASAVFPDNSINGGVCILVYDHVNEYNNNTDITLYHHDKELHRFDCIDSVDIGVMIYSHHSISIYNKVNQKSDASIQGHIEVEGYYGLATDFTKDPSKYGLPNTVYEFRQHDDDLGLHCLLRGIRSKLYLPNDYPIPKNKDNAKTYRVLSACAAGPSTVGLGYNKSLIQSKCILAEQGEYTTSTYFIMYSSESKLKAENFIKYYNSKFFAIMTSIHKCTQHMVKSFKSVPNQDFSSTSDIDWDGDIDAQLYKKYNLDDAEIDFIEKSVRARS